MLYSRDLRQFKYANLIIVLISLFSILWISFKLPAPITFLTDADGGHQLAGATQILFGEHPFIDWRSTYGPLTFYASALAQVLAGKHIIGEMMLILVGYVLAYMLLFKLLWLAGGRLSVAVIFTLLALILMPRMYKYYIVLGPILSLWAAWSHVEKPGLRSFWLLSLAIAITGLFRFDFGVYSALCGAVVVGSRPAPQFLVRIKRLIGLAATVVACASPWLIWAWLKGGLDNYFHDTLFGAFGIAIGMSLPFPRFQGDGPLISSANGIFALFIFFCALPAISIFVIILRRNRITAEEQLKMVSATILAQATLIQAVYRPDYLHLLQGIPISFILCAWLAGQAIIQLQSGSYWQRGYVAIGLGMFASLAAISIFLTTSLGMWPSLDLLALSEKLHVYAGSREDFFDYIAQKSPEHWYLHSMQYIRGCTQPSQRILALPLLTTFYYLTDRPFGGGQMALAPGFFSTTQDQIKMVKRMSTEEIPLVIDQSDFVLDGREDRRVENFAPIVFDYLDENFIEVGRFGSLVAKVRRDMLPDSTSLRAVGVLCPKD